MKEKNFVPQFEQTEAAAGFVEEKLAAEGFPTKMIMKMNIVFDELFSNVIRYSGASEATIACGVEGGEAVLRLSDNGVPYDPTLTAEPDTARPPAGSAVSGSAVRVGS